MRSLAIVAGEARVRLGDVGGRARALRQRPPILLWHGQGLERGLRALAAAYVHRLVARELPSGSGLEAWDSFLRAHATLMRRLELDLAQATGLALADFDVLAQLARAGGELRMTDLAARALISRSGMTRRVARLVEEGLVRRANADADARGVVVALTDGGVARLTETAPVHLRKVSELFVAQRDDQDLTVLKNALNKVTVDCTFG